MEHEAPFANYPLDHSVMAASIAAKAIRDRYMQRIGRRHTAYGFVSNKGYGTAEHRAALARCGPCRHHRRVYIEGLCDPSDETI